MPPIVIQKTEIATGVPVLGISGEIDLHTAQQVRVALNDLLSRGSASIVVNLAEVPYMDSAALGVFVDAVRRSKEMGGMIYLTNLMPFVRRAFEITRLVRIFAVYETVDAALTEITAHISKSSD